MRVKKCLSRHVTYSGYFKGLCVLCGASDQTQRPQFANFGVWPAEIPEVGISSAVLPHAFRFMIIRTTLAQQTESLLGHCPFCDIGH